jgi:hypothetical protein
MTNYQYTKNPYFETKKGTLEDAIKKAVTPVKQTTSSKEEVKVESKVETKEEIKEQKDSDIPARAKYSKSGGFYYWPAPVKYNRIKKFYYHPKGAKPYPPGLHTKPTDPYEEYQAEQKDNAYAIGMAAAMKQTGDTPPLEKSTITKAHDIAKSIKKEEVKPIEEVIKDMFNTSAAIQRANNSEMYKKTESHTVESSYADKFKAELEKSGKSIKDMSDDEKKSFFNKIDSKHQAKNEVNDIEISDKPDHKEKLRDDPKAGEKEVIKPVKETSHEDEKKKEVEELTAAQKKLPPALQKAIKDKEDKKEGYGKMKNESASLVDQIKEMLREKYAKKEQKDVPAGHHKMPDGTIMKDSEHKKEEVKEADEKKDDKEKAETADKIDALKKENQKLRSQITLAKVDKERIARVEPNPKTGEVPLKIGIAQKLLKQKEDAEKEGLKDKKVADTGQPASEVDTSPQYRPI